MPIIDPQNPKRNKRDEVFLGLLRDRANSHQVRKLYIFNHCTPQTIEERSLAFENPLYYKGCKQVFYDIYDSKKISRGYQKLFTYSNKFAKYKEVFKQKLIKSDWFTLIDNVIQGAFMIQRAFEMKIGETKSGEQIKVMKSANVLIYCRNGQLGSALISTIAQLLLEPNYRTIDGFKQLIWKEWIYQGHNFIKYLNLCKIL